MSFWDHIDELRETLIHSALAIVAFSVLGFIFKTALFDGFVLAPTRSDFCVYRLLGWDFSMKLINVDVSAQFFAHMKAAIGVGFVMSFPIIIYELWKFIAPALYEKEKKAVKTAFGLASGLFYLGVLVGYFVVLPVCLRFFLSYTVSDTVENSITLASYMSLFTSMVLLIGVAFEFPTVILALSRLGVVSRDTLRKGRSYACVAVMVFAALITPSDPFSMFVLAIPLYGLYEISILMCPRKNDIA